MSKLGSIINLGSRSSKKTIKTKGSSISKKSRCSGSYTSEQGSKFGRSVNRFPKCNDPGLVQSLSTDNSRVIRTIFNPILSIDPELPDLTQLQATDCIRELGKSLNIVDYEFNYASFWLLDTLSKLIKDIQKENFSPIHQNSFLSWFRFVLRCISVGGGTREEVFNLLQEMFRSAVTTIEEGKHIPQPEEVDIQDNLDLKQSADLKRVFSSASLPRSIVSKSSRKLSMKKSSSFSLKSSKKSIIAAVERSKSLSRKTSTSSSEPYNPEEDVQLNMKVFCTIVKMIYCVFADRFVYSMISLAYSSPIMLTPLDMHLEFQDPKPLKPEPVLTPVVMESPKSRKSKSPGGKKIKDKAKSKKSVASKKSTGSKKSLRASKVSEDSGDSVKKEKKSKKYKNGSKERKKTETPEKEEKGVKDAKQEKGKGKKKERTPKTSEESGAGSTKENKSKKGKKREALPKSENDVEDAKKSKENKKKQESKTAKSEKSGKSKGKKKGKSKSSKDESVEPVIVDERVIALQLLNKKFDRVDSLEVKDGGKKNETKNPYLLPLSDAVDKNFVNCIVQTVMPQEVKKQEEQKKAKETKGKSRKSKESKASSTKGKKNKSKGKKK